MRAPAWLAAGILLPQAAQAHGLSPGISDFYAGAFNLIAGPIDMLVWLSVAVLAGLHGQTRAGWVPEVFAAGLLAGLLGARATGAAVPPDLADAAALLTAGLLTAAGRPLPAGALYVLAGGIGAARGWHYGADTLARTDLPALAAGLVLAGYALLACSVAMVLWFANGSGGWRLISLRAAGSWIAAIAIMSGGFALRHS